MTQVIDSNALMSVSTPVVGRGSLTRRLCAYVVPTGEERTIPADAVLVSKTDLFGRITYISDDYLRLLGLAGEEAIGAPHSLLRHPMMPGAIFRKLWNHLRANEPFTFFLANMCASGDHFWALARVSPVHDEAGLVIGYHSDLSVPNPDCIEEIDALYERMRAVEKRCRNEAEGIAAALSVFERVLRGHEPSCARIMID